MSIVTSRVPNSQHKRARRCEGNGVGVGEEFVKGIRMSFGHLPRQEMDTNRDVRRLSSCDFTRPCSYFFSQDTCDE